MVLVVVSKMEIRVRCFQRWIPRTCLYYTLQCHTQPGAVQLCKLRIELINWCVCTASQVQMIIFQWLITSLCKKTPTSSELVQCYTAETCLVSLRQARSKTACLASPIASITAGFCVWFFPISISEVKTTCYCQFIFPISQNLALTEWVLLWSAVIVHLI